jgi:choline dehydrogenase-like flavoprotein
MATRFDLSDDSVAVIVGSGAGGGTLANELCQKGVPVVCLEAGPFITQEDYVNDEMDMFGKLTWQDARTGHPIWIVKAVGGTTVHWAGASLRFKEHEFKARTAYGEVRGANLLDWPLTLAELEPYYDRAEDKMGVTRTHGIPGLPGNNNFKVMEAGARRVGYRDVHTGRMAINSRPRDGRSACWQTGFCFQGCKPGAKWSVNYTEIPKALATGRLDLRPGCQALRIEHDASGKVRGVLYADGAGTRIFQKARVVCVAGNSIESPRLLLNSASNLFAEGLANSSRQVGKNFMRHLTGAVYATFPQPVNAHRGTTMAGIITDESRHDTSRGFAGGYYLQTIMVGLPFMAGGLIAGAWGWPYARLLEQYNHMAGMWIVGEDMAQERNQVRLDHDVKDRFGMPGAHITPVVDHANDVAMRNHAFKAGRSVYEAVGAIDLVEHPPYASTHNLGTNRMSASPRDGVVNKWGQAHDVRNLFVSDGSQFTSGAACNPTLTIVALAIRQAEYIRDQMARQEI